MAARDSSRTACDDGSIDTRLMRSSDCFVTYIMAMAPHFVVSSLSWNCVWSTTVAA
jgi:hypothetical protein